MASTDQPDNTDNVVDLRAHRIRTLYKGIQEREEQIQKLSKRTRVDWAELGMLARQGADEECYGNLSGYLKAHSFLGPSWPRYEDWTDAAWLYEEFEEVERRLCLRSQQSPHLTDIFHPRIIRAWWLQYEKELQAKRDLDEMIARQKAELAAEEEAARKRKEEAKAKKAAEKEAKKKAEEEAAKKKAEADATQQETQQEETDDEDEEEPPPPKPRTPKVKDSFIAAAAYLHGKSVLTVEEAELLLGLSDPYRCELVPIIYKAYMQKYSSARPGGNHEFSVLLNLAKAALIRTKRLQ